MYNLSFFVYNVLIFFYFLFKNFFLYKYFNIFDSRVKIFFFFKKKNFLLIFSDSGIWDYFILYIYDYFFCLYFTQCLMYFSEYSLIEKSSWRLFNFYYYIISKVLFFENFDFFFFLKFLIYTILILYIIYFYLILIF